MKKKDYRVYHFRWRDWGEFGIRILLKGIVICYLFYDSYKACLLLLPFVAADYRMMKKEKLKNQKRKLTLQFKAMMEALVNSLMAGYSLERAFEDARKDISLIYEEKAEIFEELDSILSGLKMNIPLENLLEDFGVRSGIEDIKNFADVVMAAKRSGGNLIRIIRKTVNSISDKIAVEEEIETMITSKKLEERIMMIMPYGILFYLRLSSGEFLEVLYHNVLGAMVMTVFLLAVYVADIWAGKIMEIHV
ncbi:MAG: type II secretion system F family protein [Lachnospiraceae bacterium]